MGANQEKKRFAWIQPNAIKDADKASSEDAGYHKRRHEMHQKELETSQNTAR
jgi:hypothetical protein